MVDLTPFSIDHGHLIQQFDKLTTLNINLKGHASRGPLKRNGLSLALPMRKPLPLLPSSQCRVEQGSDH